MVECWRAALGSGSMHSVRAFILPVVSLLLAVPVLVGSEGTAHASPRTAVSMPATQRSDPQARPRLERRVIRMVNTRRAAHGCRQVGERLTLRKAARRHSVKMAKANVMSHQLPGEPSLGTRITNAGYTWTLVRENIAYGLSPKAVMRLWMDSDDHRANILNCRLRHIGVGAISYNGVIWWTQDFGRPD